MSEPYLSEEAAVPQAPKSKYPFLTQTSQTPLSARLPHRTRCQPGNVLFAFVESGLAGEAGRFCSQELCAQVFEQAAALGEGVRNDLEMITHMMIHYQIA